MKVSEQLRQHLIAMKEKGVSYRQMAKIAGCCPAQLTLFINGKRGLTLNTVDKLSESFRLYLVSR